MTTIAELDGLAAAAGGQPAHFSDLFVTVDTVEQGPRGPRVKLQDHTGSRFFSVARDCKQQPPAYGQQVAVRGRVKAGDQKTFYDITAWQPAGQPPPAPQQQGGWQQQPVYAPQQAAPAAQPRRRSVMDAERLVQRLCQQSEGWALKDEVARQALISTILIGWARGELVDDTPGGEGEAQAREEDDIPW